MPSLMKTTTLQGKISIPLENSYIPRICDREWTNSNGSRENINCIKLGRAQIRERSLIIPWILEFQSRIDSYIFRNCGTAYAVSSKEYTF